MSQRLDFLKTGSDSVKAMLALQGNVDASGLESRLLHLIKLRASQINGCAYCIDMHTEDARAQGETEQRLYALNAWKETPFYSDRERAAHKWTEAVTLISDGHVPDDVYTEVRKAFDEAALIKLTMAVVAINGWIRLGIAFRVEPGTYTPAQRHAHDEAA